MMRPPAKLLLFLILSWSMPSALALDPCSRLAIVTSAEVSVSDGLQYQTESFFAGADAAAIRFIDQGQRLIAVEGEHAWGRSNGEARMGNDFHKLFALGHQYHAFLLHFERITGDARNGEIDWQDQSWPARIGEYPYGGQVALLDAEIPGQATAIIFDFPEPGRISARLLDWRQQGDTWLPFHIRIDDGARVFDYRYSEISINNRAPGWYFEKLGDSDLDEVEQQRARYREVLPRCR